ncbi:hypothetical protein, partial [Rhodopirellula bahusiensis]|uniref:hypothetical protein n=1 Tax=Rhodopirellula bahusiensis TaxID=2014065 RepID=UPI0032669728
TLVSAKIRPAHQERLALVYVRQSSTKQVEENTESTEMQYRLVDRAAATMGGHHPGSSDCTVGEGRYLANARRQNSPTS